jgi:hypothetical protein
MPDALRGLLRLFWRLLPSVKQSTLDLEKLFRCLRDRYGVAEVLTAGQTVLKDLLDDPRMNLGFLRKNQLARPDGSVTYIAETDAANSKAGCFA